MQKKDFVIGKVSVADSFKKQLQRDNRFLANDCESYWK